MDILKAFSICDSNHEVHIHGTVEDPLFQANEIGKLLGIVYIWNSIQNFDNDEKGTYTVCTRGGPQQVLCLTELGLYRLLGMSRKPIARKFQKWIANVVKEIRLNAKYELEKECQLAKHSEELKIHMTFLDLCDMKNLIYMCKLKDLGNGYYLIKIGSTQNIRSRIQNLSKTYGCAILVFALPVNSYVQFENYIHKHDDVVPFAYNDEIYNGKRSTETYKLNNEQYDKIVEMIKNDSVRFQEKDNMLEMIELEKIKAERETIQAERDKIQLQILEKQIVLQNMRMNDKIVEKEQPTNEEPTEDEIIEEEEENETDLYDFSYYNIQDRVNTRSPYIQTYDPNTLQLIKTYDSIIEVLREMDGLYPTCIKKAAANNTLYHNLRWHVLSRDQEIKQYTLPPTKTTRKVLNGDLIAMVDITKTHIVQVFPSQRDAAAARNFKGISAITNAINRCNLSSGHYWIRWNDCSSELQTKYLETNSLPDPNVHVHSKNVQQICPMTKQVVNTYEKIEEVTKKFQMSRTSLRKASESQTVHKGFMWKIVKS
jgi:prophage antirepressor-like protein